MKPVYAVLARVRWVGGRLIMRSCHALFGVRRDRVFFSSFGGRGFTDSPARICERLHALRPQAELVWQLNDPGAAPDYVRAVRPHTLAALRTISTSRCVVDNFNRPHYMLKFPDQRYVQTWHGDRGFKKMLFDMEDGKHYPDGEQMDLAVSGSDFGTGNFRSAFRYSGEVMQQGIPRNDALLSPDPAAIRDIRARLDIPEGCRVLLYAPTFRDGRRGKAQPAGMDIGRVLDRLERSTGAPWRCLTRAHSQNLAVAGATDPRARDVTDWPETTELLLAADMLITDYSSIAGDYVLLDRPVVLYEPDYDEFVASNRHMYFDLRSCPYPRAESEAALLALLDDIQALVPHCAEVRAFYGVTEGGRSAEAVARWISGQLG